MAGIINHASGKIFEAGKRAFFTWSATDETGISTVEIVTNGVSKTIQASGKSIQGDFSYTVPDDDDFNIVIKTRDKWGNSRQSTWKYGIKKCPSPEILIVNPAMGTRLSEGEAFTLTASVRSNCSVGLARFFIRKKSGQAVEELFVEEIKFPSVSGDYLSVPMHVPSRPEVGENIEIGLEIFKDRHGNEELLRTALLDFEISEDLDPPIVRMQEPSCSIQYTPGKIIEITGVAEDNIFVDPANVRMVVGDGIDESEIEWHSFSYKQKVVPITVPSPGSFGSIKVGQRFYLEFEGKIRLAPDEWLSKSGLIFPLRVKVEDNGKNISRSGAVELTIKGDEQKPEIKIYGISEMETEQRLIKPSIYVSDDFGLLNYRIALYGSEGDLLKEHKGVPSKDLGLVKFIQDFSIEIPPFNEGDNAENILTLVAEAQDGSGNSTRKTVVIRVKKDIFGRRLNLQA